jgi:hypothetical protein
MMITRMTKNSTIIKLTLASLLIGLLALGLAIVIQSASARAAGAPAPVSSPLHPDFALLDADGVNVLESGVPVSTMQNTSSRIPFMLTLVYPSIRSQEN